jgi:hypothetical protein
MVRYHERALSIRARVILLVVFAGLWLWLASAASWQLASGVVAFLALLTLSVLWGAVRDARISLTDTELRAGSRRIKVADIDPYGVSQPGDEIRPLSGGGLLSETAGSTVDTSRLIELRLRSGGRVLVRAKDLDALRTALDASLARFRVDA